MRKTEVIHEETLSQELKKYNPWKFKHGYFDYRISLWLPKTLEVKRLDQIWK